MVGAGLQPGLCIWQRTKRASSLPSPSFLQFAEQAHQLVLSQTILQDVTPTPPKAGWDLSQPSLSRPTVGEYTPIKLLEAEADSNPGSVLEPGVGRGDTQGSPRGSSRAGSLPAGLHPPWQLGSSSQPGKFQSPGNSPLAGWGGARTSGGHLQSPLIQMGATAPRGAVAPPSLALGVCVGRGRGSECVYGGG